MMRTFPGGPDDARFDMESVLFNESSPPIENFVVPAKAEAQRLRQPAPKQAANDASASMRARIFPDPARKC
jgi:hypothetical protein